MHCKPWAKLQFQRKSILYTRFGPELETHNVVTFFGVKSPRLVENSHTSSLATIPVTVVVVQIFCCIRVQPPHLHPPCPHNPLPSLLLSLHAGYPGIHAIVKICTHLVSSSSTLLSPLTFTHHLNLSCHLPPLPTISRHLTRPLVPSRAILLSPSCRLALSHSLSPTVSRCLTRPLLLSPAISLTVSCCLLPSCSLSLAVLLTPSCHLPPSCSL